MMALRKAFVVTRRTTNNTIQLFLEIYADLLEVICFGTISDSKGALVTYCNISELHEECEPTYFIFRIKHSFLHGRGQM